MLTLAHHLDPDCHSFFSPIVLFWALNLYAAAKQLTETIQVHSGYQIAALPDEFQRAPVRNRSPAPTATLRLNGADDAVGAGGDLPVSGFW